MSQQNQMSLPAFRVLGALDDAELAKFDQADLSSWLERQKDIRPKDRLLLARWQLLQNGESNEDILSEVLALGEEAPDEVARWLVSEDQIDLIFSQDIDLAQADSLPFYLQSCSSISTRSGGKRLRYF